jgi:hypothetical protein
VCENQAADIIFMKCPFCQHDIAAAWQVLNANTDHLGRPINNLANRLHTTVLREAVTVQVNVIVQWLQCQNEQCREIIIQITRIEATGQATFIALPKHSALPVLNSLIVDPWRKDYLEAWKILEDSPRMSAVLSRRILGDLLAKYAGMKQYGFTSRIDAFIKDSKHPLPVRQNLHYLREMGDFGAHTQIQQAAPASVGIENLADPVIIAVDKAEASGR